MRFRRSVKAAVPQESQEGLEIGGSDQPAPGRERWSTTFLIVGSALLGATALAFWNRRTIASLRAQIEAGSAAAPGVPRSDQEIF